MSQMSVAAIVVVQNEETTIRDLMHSLRQDDLFQDILVVCDGSVDRTPEMALSAGASYVQHFALKRGDGVSWVHAVSRTRASVLFLADARVRGTSVQVRRSLIQPVQDGRVALHVGAYTRGPIMNGLARLVPSMGDIHVISRKVFEQTKGFAFDRFAMS